MQSIKLDEGIYETFYYLRLTHYPTHANLYYDEDYIMKLSV